LPFTKKSIGGLHWGIGWSTLEDSVCVESSAGHVFMTLNPKPCSIVTDSNTL
jgi:hypothetical protein